MQYEEIIEIIQSKRRFGKAYGRDVTAEMMERLEHPEADMKIIHIAGTNGKGSTAAFVSSILHAAGFVVGRFTSPHLIRFTERIVVDGEEIRKEDVIRLYQKVESELSARERIVLKLRYGLYNEEEYTQREIAKMLGISRSYVSRIEKSAIEKLRAFFPS